MSKTNSQKEKDIKTFLGDWKVLDNGKMRRIVDPIRKKWFKNEIKMAEIRGYKKCLEKRISELKYNQKKYGIRQPNN